jgi:TonB-linked SusC/RagA family outer membrane protein
LPKFQDVFGQGSYGQFSYVDGKGGGISDGEDYSWGPKMDGRLISQFHSDGAAVPFVAHPNNVKNFFKTGVTQDYGISVAGFDSNYDFRLGTNFQDQTGTVPNTEVKKTNFTLNTNYQLSKHIKIGATANYIITDAPNLPAMTGADNQQASVMQQVIYFGRQVDMAELKEDWTRSWNSSYYSNPYWRAYYNTTSQLRNRLIGDVHFDVNIINGLDFKFRSGTDYYNDRRKYKIKTGTVATPDGSYAEDAYTVSENNTEAILKFTRDLSTDFNLDVLGGFNVRNQTYTNNFQKATKLATPDLFTLSNSKDPLTSTNYYSRRKVYSTFASAQLGYKNYAFLNLTGRNDWSSTLPSSNRSYFYPSATASVVISELLGLNNNVVNFLKLRGGWSEVGSDAEPYQLATVYNIQQSFDGNPILTSSRQTNNPNLKPETTQSIEVGFELGLLDNRVFLDVALYNTNSFDQILSVPTTPASGFDSQLLNAGKINNKGVEVQLKLVPIEFRTFKWDMDLNYAANRSEVIELDKEDLLEGGYVLASAPYGGLNVIATIGEPYGTLYGVAYKRNDAGKIIVGANGLPVIDNQNNKIFGHYTPNWVGSIGNTFTYRNLALFFLIDASIGGSIYSDTNVFGNRCGVLAQTLPGRDAEHGGLAYQYYLDGASRIIVQNGATPPVDKKLYDGDDGIIVDGVTADGKPNTIITTAQDYYRPYQVKENYVYDASYVKLREIRLTYAFDKKLVHKIGIEGLSVSAVARNLAILYKNAPNIDPEVATGTGNGQGIEVRSLPSTHSIGFNVNLKF